MEFDFRIIILLLWLVYTLFRRGRELSRTAPGTGRRQRRPRPAGPRPATSPAPAGSATMVRRERAGAESPDGPGDGMAPGASGPEEAGTAGLAHEEAVGVSSPVISVPLAISYGAPEPRAARRSRRLSLGNPVEGIVWQAVLGPPRAHRPWRPRVP